VKSWKKRWCVLKNGCILYAKAQNGGQLGSVDLQNVTPEQVKFVSEYKKRKNLFSVETPNRTYYMHADDERDTLHWIQAVREQIKHMKQDSKKKISVEDFEVMRPLGKGNFGRVFQVKQKDTGGVYAMKVLEKRKILENEMVDSLMTEKNILQNLVHPFLVHLYYCFQTTDQLFFVMEFVSGGDLLGLIEREGRLSPELSQYYAAEILLGMEYLHANGVIYRDLKTENILINYDGHLCLTDFGIAKDGMHTPDRKTMTVCGSPDYLAPEILTEIGYNNSVDYWAFGCVIFEMLTGLPPFFHEDLAKMYTRIQNAPVEFPSDYPKNAIAITTALLVKDPNKRCCEPKTLKSNAYFAGLDWERLLRKEITPLYKPELKDPTDTSYFQTTGFTWEERQITGPSSNRATAIPKLAQESFNDFSFLGHK